MDRGKTSASLKDHPLKTWRITQPEQKPAKNDDRTPQRALSVKRPSISTEAGKQYSV
jgi:hypothetical protein